MARRDITYDLIIAYDRHDAQGHHPRASWAELGAAALIPKDNVGVQVGIEVLNAVRSNGFLERRLTLTTWIVGTVAGSIVQAIAVNCHVGEGARAGLQENGVGDVGAVDITLREDR